MIFAKALVPVENLYQEDIMSNVKLKFVFYKSAWKYMYTSMFFLSWANKRLNLTIQLSISLFHIPTEWYQNSNVSNKAEVFHFS